MIPTFDELLPLCNNTATFNFLESYVKVFSELLLKKINHTRIVKNSKDFKSELTELFIHKAELEIQITETQLKQVVAHIMQFNNAHNRNV